MSLLEEWKGLEQPSEFCKSLQHLATGFERLLVPLTAGNLLLSLALLDRCFNSVFDLRIEFQS